MWLVGYRTIALTLLSSSKIVDLVCDLQTNFVLLWSAKSGLQRCSHKIWFIFQKSGNLRLFYVFWVRLPWFCLKLTTPGNNHFFRLVPFYAIFSIDQPSKWWSTAEMIVVPACHCRGLFVACLLIVEHLVDVTSHYYSLLLPIDPANIQILLRGMELNEYFPSHNDETKIKIKCYISIFHVYLLFHIKIVHNKILEHLSILF